MAGERSQAERWVSFAAGIVAPVTLISGLLFYFGYVSARAQYEYFGIDVDTVGLSTQDYVMRSPQPLLVPLLVITLLAVAALLLHNVIRTHLAVGLIRRARIAATAVLVLGVLGLLAYPFIGEIPYYALLVPLVIGLAAAALGYLTYLATRAQPELGTQHILLGLLAVVTITCAFWATATTAQYSGRGLAKSDAKHLGQFPVVILDTKERLQLRSPGIEETVLRPGAGQTFNFRYRGLRLLVVGENRLFLVPQKWSAANTTFVVPLDSSIRVQFQFQNDPP
ncbi:hypothetical protein [Kribbella monticola]|uniref:hypothetical protein n=1 Tax=Kribbella monticola TaxID=2185285 RepID=UPI000DD48713|nr:hypothetical protein [Kribbella monticola]